MNNLKQLLVYLVLLPGSLSAQNYLWPTDASTYMSSSFCEFRNGHYHSAIDIKTWLREGYKCFAIEDGEIVRIRVSPFGYGKVLYLRLKDGNTAVYAHLQRFTPKIEAQIRKKQLANKKYRLDWSPKNLMVKKGDIIAYTGRTGIGVPHFHFEIRNSKGNPVNPLAFYSEIKDSIRPTLEQIAVIPLESGATVNKSFVPRVFDLTRISSGNYRIKDMIRVRGRVGLAIRGIDRADDVGNKYGFYRTRLEVGEQPVFQITYDELDFATTEHIFTELSYPIWIKNRTHFHKLYIEPFNPLRFYTRFPGTDGSITINDSVISFKIDVRDFHGNQSTIEGELAYDSDPSVQIRGYERSGSWAYLDFVSEPFNDLSLDTGPDFKRLKSVDYFEIYSGKIYQPQEGLKIKIGLEDSTDQYLRLGLSVRDAGESFSMISPAPPDSVEPEIYFMGDRIVLEMEDHFYPLHLSVADQSVMFQATDIGRIQALLPDSLPETLPVPLTIFSSTDVLWTDTLNLSKLLPDHRQKISWFDSTLTIVSEPGTVIEPFLISTGRYDRAMLSDSLPAVSSIYEIYPENLLLFSQMEAFFQTDSLPDKGTWGLFRVSDSGMLSFSARIEELSKTHVRTRIGGPGKFIIACDTIPPVLDVMSPINGAVYTTWPKIRFHTHDQHSKISDEDNISILLDGQFVLPEWDPEDELIEASIDQSPAKGAHTITISISDQSNNITRIALLFTIR